MKRSSRWAFGLVAMAAIAIVLIVALFDWNWIKGPLESRLSSLTGKDVRIDGRITGTKGWVPRIVIPRISIQAPEFAAAPEVATIASVTIAIDLRQLLSGRIDFPAIEIEKPVLNLMRTADGKANWDIAKDSSGPSDRSSAPIFGEVKLTDGSVTYQDIGRRTTLKARIASVFAHGGEGRSELDVEGNGVYRDAPFTLRLKGGSLDELRDTRQPYRVDAAAAVGKTRVSITGTVTDPFKLTDMNLKLTADGDNAEELYTIFGAPAPPTPPYHVAGTLDRDGKTWLFKHFSGTVGKSDLSGDLRLDPTRKRLFVGGSLVSRTLDFADLGTLVGAPGDTSGDRPASDTQKELARRSAQSGRVLPDAPLNLDEVRNIDADITFKADHVQARALPLEDVALHLTLDNAILRLAPFDVGVAGGRVASDIAIDARGDTVKTDYDIRFHGFQIAQFFQHVGAAEGASGSINGRVRLTGVGDSVRRSLATSTGQASAIVDQGTISNLAADLLGLDIVKSVGLLITGGDKQVPMRCMVADFDVQNGIMRPRALVLDTDQTLVTGTGSISLADESLDLAISGAPKDVTLSLGGPITIGGTFKSPSVGLGAAAIARGAGAIALGALLTPLAAAIGFIDAGESHNADCQGLEQRAAVNGSKPPPGAPKAARTTKGPTSRARR